MTKNSIISFIMSNDMIKKNNNIKKIEDETKLILCNISKLDEYKY